MTDQQKGVRVGSIDLDLGSHEAVSVQLTFQPSVDGYQVVAQPHFDGHTSVTLPRPARLGESAEVQIGDQTATLGELVQHLIDYKARDLVLFQERGQFEFGRKLFDETVAQIESLANHDRVHLRIVTEDEHVMRLPWPLLNRRGIFLIHEKWSTSLSHGTGILDDASLRSIPNILVVCPDPFPDSEPTESADHLNDLRTLLRSEDYDLGSPENMLEVRTWHQFTDAVDTGAFDVIYYYGHGEGDRNSSRLLFERAGGGVDSRSIRDFASLLRKINPIPTLAYVNCCYGDASGLLGIGNQLGDFIPSVVTNRTAARVSSARTQACAFFRLVILDAVAPHEAVSWLYRELPGAELDSIQPEWFTPIHHANYSKWHHVSPRDARKPRIDPNWKWMLDRKNQYGPTAEQMRRIVNRQIKKRAHAIVVHGGTGNGLRHFQERIRCLIHESAGIDGKTYKPSWPSYAAGDGTSSKLRQRSFMQIIESIGQQTIPDLVRDFRRGVGGNKTLIVFNHAIVSDPKVLNSQQLSEYLQWWNHLLDTEIDDENLFFLFAFFFEVNAGIHRTAFQHKMKTVRRKRMKHIDMEVLLPLSELEEDDLIQFIDDHDLFIPDDRQEDVAAKIIRDTGGEYERSIELLDAVVQGECHRILDTMREHESESSDEPGW